MSTFAPGAATAPASLAVPVVSGSFVDLDGARFYRIAGVDRLEPFLISLVSAADHWFFIASSGGLTAGRVSPETALFPYETVDRLYDCHPHTGPLTILHVTRAGTTHCWEPFASRSEQGDRIERNLYKDTLSTTLVFEELNHTLGLAFRVIWQTSPRFGFVRTCRLVERAGVPVAVRVLDGLQNLLPYGATTVIQRNYSNLLDAYKRAEYDPSGLAIFALSSQLTDLAEASESLRATVAWQHGLNGAVTLLSSAQVAAFRRGVQPLPKDDVRGQRGAFLVATTLELAPGATHVWRIVADVAQDAAAVADLARALRDDPDSLAAALVADIARGQTELTALVAAADGLQQSADTMAGAHHAANTLFNIMRGGVFADGYRLDSADLRAFIAVRNPALLEAYASFFTGLPAHISVRELRARAAASGVASLERLCTEYLPLTFSRRHGDPSRPWNRFSINVREADGRRRLDYQGNWRDLFQNWEPLAYAFPAYLEGMIALFLNATTADGYNPYRLSRAGVEWEVPEPGNPWANIGYWSDHQIIYLLKLLEAMERCEPGRLAALLNRRCFSHVDVPYRIKPYAALLTDPAATIVFDWEHERRIAARVAAGGTDGKLLAGPDGQVLHVSLGEKLLLLLLAKAERVRGLDLVAALTAAGDRRLLVRDADGDYHFGGDLHNLRDVRAVLAALKREPRFAARAEAAGPQIEALFEEVFRHSEFTGRSGSFFAYEGLGSIYWHMVAKLLLAVQEVYHQALERASAPAVVDGLARAYRAIRAGLGFQKTPAAYGAFPTDPYSHTPLGRGAQQPGMTGQVKEEILTRMGELGVTIRDGQVSFRPRLLDPGEWSTTASDFHYYDVAGVRRHLALPPNALAFTYCQTPVIYVRATAPAITLHYADGATRSSIGDSLDDATSQHLLARDGTISAITVAVEDASVNGFPGDTSSALG